MSDTASGSNNFTRFHSVVRPDTPRLGVHFRRDADNHEQFQWGMAGKIPLATLIGGLVRVQAELHFRHAEPCPEPALVIVWHEESRSFEWFVDPGIPLDSLVGMLELIKATLVNTHMARQAAAQQVGLLGPDGQPMRR